MATHGHFLFYHGQIFGDKPLSNIQSTNLGFLSFLLVCVLTYLPSQHSFMQSIILHSAVLNSTMCMCAIYVGLTNNELFLTLMLASQSNIGELTSILSSSLYSSHFKSQFLLLLLLSSVTTFSRMVISFTLSLQAVYS